jgi:Zn-dependent protease with chaperone function/uncharacterized tellurite resistance protein B-like protein
MNFVEQQLRARKASRYLLTSMAVAILTIVGVLYTAAAIVRIEFHNTARPMSFWQPGTLALVLLGFSVVSGGASFVRYYQLRKGGGASVALSLGGRIISPATTDPDERRLNNIVDEMSIASSMPRPIVFVLDQEPSINAFAAGYSPADSVVAVSAGALKRLTRDELTGVVAHEFSHIANGDTAINLQLIAATAGILVLSQVGVLLFRFGVVGSGRRSASRRSGRNEAGAALFMIGTAALFWVLGSIGVLAARLIRAGLSRQREYLADASAVQYTRNPTGLGDALERVLNEQSQDHRPPNTFTEEVNHMLLIEALSNGVFSSWLASHPPLARRVALLRGTPVPKHTPSQAPPGTDARVLGLTAENPHANALPSSVPPAAPPSRFSTGRERVDARLKRRPEVPEELRAASREFLPAAGLVLATLLARDGATRSAQVQMIRHRTPAEVASEALRAYPAVQRMDATSRLAVVELCFSTLRQLADTQKTALIHAISELCLADGRIESFEFVLYALATDSLMSPRRRTQGGNPYDAARMLLTYLAVCGHQSNPSLGVGAVHAGLARLQVPHNSLFELPDYDSLDMGQVSSALDSLRMAGRALRLAFIEASRDVVLFDGEVTEEEHVLLRAMELVLGVA